MLFYGSSNIGLFEYLRDNRCAYLAESKDQLHREIMQMICRQGDCEIRKNAIQVAEKNHSIEVARKIFVETIAQSCL